jgi:hypothetical protein
MRPRLVLQTIAAAVITATAVTTAVAQSERERERLDNERDLEQRVFNLGTLDKRSGRNAARRDPQLTPAQLQEDFTRLQVLNNSLAEAVSKGGALDLKFVAKSASEIKDRAARLKENLALPKPPKEEKPPQPALITDQEQLKRALRVLDALIIGFTHNPAFKEARADDAELSARARRDLVKIIELSGRLKRSSEELRKAARKAQ